MKNLSTEQKIIFTLRMACAMCFIGHGAFGLVTKAIWCNYFGVFHISPPTAYQLMPLIGMIDICLGLLLLVYPTRSAFAWLVLWGFFTALLRPLSGEPVAEFFERAGNYGAPFLLLLAIALGETKKQPFFTRLTPPKSLQATDYRLLGMGLRLVGFLLFAGHAWLNLLGKKGLLDQYASLGFSSPAMVAQAVGMAEVGAAFLLLLRPTPSLVLGLFVWKMGSELFYPHYELLEWVERGGSYGVLLALWLTIRQQPVPFVQNPFRFLSAKFISIQSNH